MTCWDRIRGWVATVAALAAFGCIFGFLVLAALIEMGLVR
jgi:hypothetical protein